MLFSPSPSSAPFPFLNSHGSLFPEDLSGERGTPWVRASREPPLMSVGLFRPLSFPAVYVPVRLGLQVKVFDRYFFHLVVKRVITSRNISPMTLPLQKFSCTIFPFSRTCPLRFMDLRQALPSPLLWGAPQSLLLNLLFQFFLPCIGLSTLDPQLHPFAGR